MRGQPGTAAGGTRCPAVGRSGCLPSAGTTHVAQVQELGFVGGAQEGRAGHQVDLCAGGVTAGTAATPGAVAALPSPTCRVGSREARWASCSLNAFSFSSCWLRQSRAWHSCGGAAGSHWHPIMPRDGGDAPRRGGSACVPAPLHGFQECLLPLGELLLQTARPPRVTQATPLASRCPSSAVPLGHPGVQGVGWRPLPRTCMRPKRELMAASSSLALLRTSSIMALRRTMASRVDVCSSFTAWRSGGVAVALPAAPQPRAPRLPETHRPCPPSPPGPAAGSPACTPSRCRCSAPGSPCGHGRQGTAWGTGGGGCGAGTAHPCMSLKQLMQSMDFFSVENMM